MSEAIIFENMPYNLFLKQRMEFVVICGDHLAANVMRVIESEMIRLKEAWQAKVEKATEEKKTPPKEPKAWWVRLSLSQIIARLYMYDSDKLKKPESEDLNSPEWVEYRYKKALSISKGTLRKAIKQLKSLGFLLERSKPGDEFGAPIWTLHKENVQKALKTLPQNPFAIFHSLGGGSKFEYGGEVQNLNVPPTNFECGDTQNLNVPGSENAGGEMQNLEVDIDSSIDTSLDNEIDNEEEGTLPRDHDDTGTIVPTPALSHDRDATYTEAWEAYKRIEPNYARTNQMLANGEMPDHIAIDTPTHEDTQAPSEDSVDYTQDGEQPTEKRAAVQLSTSVPQSGKVSHARVAPARPAQSGRGKGSGKQQAYTIYWSLEASQVRNWYQEASGMVMDDTAPNAAACHHLSKKNGMDYDTLKAVQALIDADEWLSNHNQAVGPQELADDNGKWRWERWVQVVRRNQKKLEKSMTPTNSFDSEVEASRAAMREVAAREKARAQA